MCVYNTHIHKMFTVYNRYYVLCYLRVIMIQT